MYRSIVYFKTKICICLQSVFIFIYLDFRKIVLENEQEKEESLGV